MESHVVLVSIDGLRPEIYLDPKEQDVSVPNLQALMARGTYAQAMTSVFPSMTMPAHATLVTGSHPATHGIYNNNSMDGRPHVDAADIQAQTIWQDAAEEGLSSASVFWPTSLGADVDYLIALPFSKPGEDLKSLVKEASTMGLVDELEAGLGPVEIRAFREPNYSEIGDQAAANFAAQLLKDKQLNLLIVHFADGDTKQHLAGPDAEIVKTAFETIDGYVGKLVKAAEDAGLGKTTTFIVVRDHGFVNIHSAVNATALLAEAAAMDADCATPTGTVTSRAAGGSAAVYLNDNTDVELKAQLLESIPKLIEERYANMVTFIGPDELAELHGFPGALFALSAADGYLMTAAPTSDVIAPYSMVKGMHGHVPTMPQMATGFIAAGPAIRENYMVPQLEMIDVAPTIARILGFALDADGAPAEELFK